MMKKENRIEIFFWLAAFLVFSPRILIEVYERKLAKELIPFGDNVWRVKDERGAVIHEKLKLPYDLRNTEEKTTRRVWVFEKEVNTEELKGTNDVGVVLGRMGDSDYVKFNDCTIGSTALNLETMNVELRGWSLLRKYQVPSQCMTYPTATIQIHVYKWGGPGYGIYGGPMGFGKYSSVLDKTNLIDFFRYNFLAAFGLGLIFFIGIQYLLIALLSQTTRELYGVFGLLSISTGIYLITNSKVPSQLMSHFGMEKKVLFASAATSSILFLYFIYKKLGGLKKILLVGYTCITIFFMVLGLFQKTHGAFYAVYELWFPWLLLMYVVAYIQVFFGRGAMQEVYYWKYFICYTVFVLCCFHDVIVTVFGLSSTYMIGYAYTFFVLVVGLTMSREYADAYDRIEDQVELRTSELNRALQDIKSVQKLKDEQARTFAHDIRSPLSALQVLRDTIDENISEDQSSIFNDTIVRINDLANTILPKEIALDDGKRSANSVFLWTLIDKLLSEKRVKYQNIPDFLIEAKSLTPLFDIHAVCDEKGLKIALSKILDYCVDTRKLNLSFILTILIEKKNDKVEIIIQDNGKGIPLRFEPSSGESTVGQEAKKLIQSWGGDIDVYSTENVGHTITIHLKIGDRPEWLASKLDLTKVENFIVLDGQRYVIDTWKQKLRQLDKNFNIYWAKNADEWKKYNLEDLTKKPSIFLIDQNLSADSTGLEFIQKFKLGTSAVLVSANEDDRLLRVKAQALNISILPKSLIYAVPVEI